MVPSRPLQTVAPPCSSPNKVRLCQLPHSPALSGPMVSHHTKGEIGSPSCTLALTTSSASFPTTLPFSHYVLTMSASPLCLQHGKHVPVSRHFLLLFLLLLLPLPPGRKISQMSAWSPPQFSQVFPLSVYP